jgi:hypothetical protein
MLIWCLIVIAHELLAILCLLRMVRQQGRLINRMRGELDGSFRINACQTAIERDCSHVIFLDDSAAIPMDWHFQPPPVKQRGPL